MRRQGGGQIESQGQLLSRLRADPQCLLLINEPELHEVGPEAHDLEPECHEVEPEPHDLGKCLQLNTMEPGDFRGSTDI